jgi:transglutaminase-like putative cysteine protease
MGFFDWLKGLFVSNPVVEFTWIPSGIEGTKLVIDNMRRFALDGLRDERIHQLARQIIKGVPDRDQRGQAAALLAYIQAGGKGGYRYIGLPWHPEGFQRLCHPSYTLFTSPTLTGECASLTTALVSLAMAIGIESRFRTAGQDAAKKDEYEHVYAIFKLDGAWVAADPSYEYPLGWPHRAGDTVGPVGPNSSPAVTWADWNL